MVRGHHKGGRGALTLGVVDRVGRDQEACVSQPRQQRGSVGQGARAGKTQGFLLKSELGQGWGLCSGSAEQP